MKFKIKRFQIKNENKMFPDLSLKVNLLHVFKVVKFAPKSVVTD